ncbi:MAG: hypothetical protein M0T72_06910 [Candidatus Dormibacteraeota bacterium]|nr:hypothetical protein [Candidatus Dormibacteraeota bacterium]
MNTICLVYTYDDLNGYADHEPRTLTDHAYAKAGQQMGFIDSSLRHEIYRQISSI